MRDPARIDQILAALREAWLKTPDERLGQFLDNCAGDEELPCELGCYYRGFLRNIEDDKWLNVIKSRFSKE
jgi:hypothetical protein